MEYRTPSIRELSRGTYSISGSSAAQLYTVVRPTDPLTPSWEALNDPLGLRWGGPGNLIHPLTGGLNERFDFSGHGGLGPHINYDLYGTSGEFSRRALGDQHKIDLDK